MSLLNVSTRALLANQSALQTVGHNISNVNTPGYSRQSVVLQSVKGQYTGGGYIGNGVDLLSVQRNHSELLTRQSTAAESVKASDTIRSDRMRLVEDIFTGGTEGLGAGINDMMNSLADVASKPTDLAARTVFLTRADETAMRMNSASERLDNIEYGLVEEINNSVQHINTITPQIAALNELIVNAKGNGQPPNDLLDQRDQLIRDLNTYIQTSQVNSSDGSINLFVAGSQALVMSNSASTLSVQDNKSYGGGTGRKAVYITQPSATTALELNEDMLGGGKVSGLVRFQNAELAEARNLIGRMALAIGQTLNDQNERGLTLDGAQGGPLFTLPQVEYPAGSGTNVLGAKGSAANSAIQSAVLYKTPDKYSPSDYQVVLDGPNSGSVIRLADKKVVGSNIDFSDPAQRVIDGLEFVISGGNSGDQVLFKPFSGAAGEIKALVIAPNDLAAANPLNAKMETTNRGTLNLVSLKVTGAPTDTTNNPFAPAQGTKVQLTFKEGPPMSYSVTGATNPASNVTDEAYTSGQAIKVDGWEIALQGAPKTGDTVTIGNALDSSTGGDAWYKRDAGNADAMLGLRSVPLFDGATLSDGFAGVIAQIGSRSQTASFATNLSTSIAANLDRERSAVSGVNLDEEASKLLQYQQAYQAASKAIQVAQTLFSDLIQVLGR